MKQLNFKPFNHFSRSGKYIYAIKQSHPERDYGNCDVCGKKPSTMFKQSSRNITRVKSYSDNHKWGCEGCLKEGKWKNAPTVDCDWNLIESIH